VYTAAAIPRGGLFLSERESSSTSPPHDAFNCVLKLLMEDICKTAATNTVRPVMDKTPTYALFTQHYISLVC